MKRVAKIHHNALQLGRMTLGLSLATGLLFATVAAEAQINRSRPPSQPSGGSSGGTSGGSSGSDKKDTSGGTSSGGSSRSGSDRGSSGGGSSSGGSERTRTPNKSGRTSGSGSRSDGGSGSSGTGSSSGGAAGILNRSRSNTGGTGGSSRSDSGNGSGSRSGSTYNNYGSGARGNWSNSREATSGRLAPFSYNSAARTRTNFPSSVERFTQSREGQNYRYNNGTYGRSELYVYNGGNWNNRIFVNNAAYYPYYRPAFVAGVTCYSPFAYYGGIFPSYINLNSVYFSPPPVVYVPYPVYTDNGAWRGYRSDGDDDYLNQREHELDRRERDLNQSERTDRSFERVLRSDRALESTVNEITEAWRFRDIQALARHTRSESPIAVYLRGKYQYSLSSVDYLDMTRDAFRTSKTVRFRLDQIERKERGVYLVSGRHTYRNNANEERSVYVNYVLEREDDTYQITQVGSSPDRISNDD